MIPSGREGARLHVLAAPRRRAGAVGNPAEVARDEPIAIGLEVAREHVVAVAEVEIGAHEIPLRVVGGIRGAEEVARAARIRQREQIHHLARDRIDALGRNRVVRERQSGLRIAHGAREDAVALVDGRHRGRANHALGEPCRLDVAEEERFALDDRAAEVAAEVVLLVIRLRRALTDREEIIRVEFVVAQELVRGSVQRVRTRLRGDADGGARRLAELRRVRARDDLELADRIHRRPRHLRRQFLDVFGNRVVVEAVEQEIVLQRTDAVHVDAARAARRRAARLFRVAIALHAGGEAEQVVPVTQRQRQVGDLRLADDGAERRLLRVDERRRRFHADALLERADGEREVEARALARLAESLQLDVDDVLAGDERRDDVTALCIGDCLRGDVGADVHGRHRGARYHRVGLILDSPGDRGAFHLCRSIRRRRQQQHAGDYGVQHSRHELFLRWRLIVMADGENAAPPLKCQGAVR